MPVAMWGGKQWSHHIYHITWALKKLLLLFVNLATYLREDFRESFATTVWAFAEHMGKQELSRPFRGESGGAYLRPKALLFVHCKENRRRLAVRLDKKDGQTWHVPRVVLTTYCLGVGLRSLHFLRVPSLHWPYVLKGGPMDFGRGIFRATFAKLSRTFRKNSVPNPGKSKKLTNGGFAYWSAFSAPSQRLFVSIHTFKWILPEPSRNLPEHALQLQFHSSIHEQTRQISHIFTCQLSRLSRSTFAFAIFREAAFSFRAGTPD